MTRLPLYMLCAASVAHADATPELGEVPADDPAPAASSDDTKVEAKVEPTPLVVKPKWIEPFGAIAGGVHLQSLHQPPTATAQTQNPTVAISRLGVRGGVGRFVTFASEFEASLGGSLGYGASV